MALIPVETTLQPTSYLSLFKLIFALTIANTIEMNLCLYMCILMDMLAVFQNSYLSLQCVYVKNAKIYIFFLLRKKKDFECNFYRFEVHVITIWFSGLGKNTRICNFAYGRLSTHF